MTIHPATSPNAETCFRCLALGLPAGGIAPHEEHVRITDVPTPQRACLDCYARLFEEIAGNQGDDWKIEG